MRARGGRPVTGGFGCRRDRVGRDSTRGGLGIAHLRIVIQLIGTGVLGDHAHIVESRGGKTIEKFGQPVAAVIRTESMPGHTDRGHILAA
ncbi:hypothetical protein FPV58_19815 [Mycolicibacterium porcinum]|nr:hypothetical protein FPV58_19815 [Mycolicibacterium porcinum]